MEIHREGIDSLLCRKRRENGGGGLVSQTASGFRGMVRKPQRMVLCGYGSGRGIELQEGANISK